MYVKKQSLSVVFSLSQLLENAISITTPSKDDTLLSAATPLANSSVPNSISPTAQHTIVSSTGTLHPKSSKITASSLEFASPQSSVSPDSPVDHANSFPVHEYSFTYPSYMNSSYIQVSYQDTIYASWISVPPDHPPNLIIQCWDRNSTTPSNCAFISSVASSETPATLFLLCYYQITDNCVIRSPQKAPSNPNPGDSCRHNDHIFSSLSPSVQRLEPLPTGLARPQYHRSQWRHGDRE